MCALGTLATLQISPSSFKCIDEKTTLITVNLQTRKTVKLTFMASVRDLQPTYCSVIYGVILFSHHQQQPPSHELPTEGKLARCGEALVKDLVFDGCGGVCL